MPSDERNEPAQMRAQQGSASDDVVRPRSSGSRSVRSVPHAQTESPGIDSIASEMRSRWRESRDVAAAVELAEQVAEVVSTGDPAVLDCDRDYDAVVEAVEILGDTGDSDRALKLAEDWRRAVVAAERSELDLSELSRLDRNTGAATLTTRALYVAGDLERAQGAYAAGMRQLRTAAGGDRELSDAAECDPFEPIGRAYARHLAVGISVARLLPKLLREQALERMMRDAGAIVRSIPIGDPGYEWLHVLVVTYFFALAERQDPNDAPELRRLAKIDRELRPADTVGHATRPLVDMELAHHRGDEFNSRRHAKIAHRRMEAVALTRQLTAIMARGWCRAS